MLMLGEVRGLIVRRGRRGRMGGRLGLGVLRIFRWEALEYLYLVEILVNVYYLP